MFKHVALPTSSEWKPPQPAHDSTLLLPPTRTFQRQRRGGEEFYSSLGSEIAYIAVLCSNIEFHIQIENEKVPDKEFGVCLFDKEPRSAHSETAGEEDYKDDKNRDLNFAQRREWNMALVKNGYFLNYWVDGQGRRWADRGSDKHTQ